MPVWYSEIDLKKNEFQPLNCDKLNNDFVSNNQYYEFMIC